MRCFVPNCENKITTGIVFPQDLELRNTWLKNLHITETVPDEYSFVCLDHFKSSDIEETLNADGVVEKKVLPNAVPRLFELDKVIEKETEEFLEFKTQKFSSNNQADDNVEPVQAKTEFEPSFQPFPVPDFILNEVNDCSTSNASKQETENVTSATTYQTEDQNFLNVQHEFTPQEVFTPENQTDQIYPTSEQTEPPVFTSEPPLLPEENQQVFNTEQQNIPVVPPFQDDSMDETHENIAKMVAENQPNINVQSDDQNSLQISTSLPDNVGENRNSFESAQNIVMQWFVPNEIKREQEDISNDEDKITITYQQEMENSQVETVQQQIVIEKNQNDTTMEPEQFTKVSEIQDEDRCRLCMSNEQVTVNILDNIKDNIMVLEAIQLCLHPLEISLEDPFSKKICQKCLEILQTYHEFRQNCIQIDTEQKISYEKTHPHYKFEKPKPTMVNTKRTISPNERSFKQGEVVRIESKDYNKNISKKVIITPTSKRKYSEYLMRNTNDDKSRIRQILSSNKSSDDVQVYKIKGKTKENGSSYYRKVDKRPIVPIRISSQKLNQSQIEAIAKKPPLPTAKQLRIQEELKKVIEGKMSKDDLSVDHVIVRVVSDDENDDFIPAKRQKHGVPVMESRKEYNTMRFGQNEIAIPKSIRVSIPGKFESNKGIFPLFTKIGPFSNEFAVIDGYLFEQGLRKGYERKLKCVLTKCPAMAIQKMLSNGKYEPKATVKISHNHHQPMNAEMKKQMVFYVMKRKSQIEKSVNLHSIYDQICQKDPEIRDLIPLRSVINEISKHAENILKTPQIKKFDDFYDMIECEWMHKLQFTYTGRQFYQEKFEVPEEGSKAIIFANADIIRKVSRSKLMYVDASFRIQPGEDCQYQLVTVLVWIDDCYYPIMFALVNSRTMEIFKKVFSYLHDTLAPNLCPEEIVTDYEANIYYALGETYLDSHIGGSVFYYTQNLYKKICELGLSKELESTPYFRHIYHMLLMLPLLPVNTIADGLQNVEIQANDIGVYEKTEGLFKHVKEQWMEKVTPDLFCVHRLENRINENVLSPYKKLRDFLLIAKNRNDNKAITIVNVVEKLIELEQFLQTTYASESKKSFGRDLSSLQKKNVMKAWQYIETHPKININHFFLKVIGYIKCMENQLWIWGYYKFSGKVTDDLINASNFSIVNTNETVEEPAGETSEENPNVKKTEEQQQEQQQPQGENSEDPQQSTVVVEAVVGPSGEFVISNPESNQEIDNSIFNYVYKE